GRRAGAGRARARAAGAAGASAPRRPPERGPTPRGGAGRAPGASGAASRLRHPAAERGGAVTRPVAQRRVGTLRRDLLVGRERATVVLELLLREAEAGERAIARPRLGALHGRGRLERLPRRAEAPELQLRLTLEHERLRPHGVFVAPRGRLRLGRRLLPLLALERRLREVERGAKGERVSRELLAEPPPRGLLVLGASEPPGERARVVERFSGGRRLLQELLVGVLHLAAVALARERLGDQPARRRHLVVARRHGHERAQVLDPGLVARADAGHAEQVLRVGGELVVRILRREGGEDRHRVAEALQLHEGARQIEGRGGRERVVGPAVQHLAEGRHRRLGPPELELALAEAVEGPGRERRRRVVPHHGLVGGARLGEAAQTEQRLALPELDLVRRARRGELLQAPERLQRRLGVAE